MLVVGIACLNCVSFLSHRVLPAKIEYCSFYGKLYDWRYLYACMVHETL